MVHACVGWTGPVSLAGVDGLGPSLSKILFCVGLPILLSVIGRALSKYVRHYRTFECACDVDATTLEKKRRLVGDMMTEGGSILDAGIALSLESLEEDFSQCIAEHSLETDHSVCDLYISLCALPSRVWIAVSVLGQMWQLDEDAAMDIAALFCDMSLA